MNDTLAGSVSPEQARAERLYPSTAQSSPQAPPENSTQAPRADELAAARMYPQTAAPKPETGLPPEVAALRNEPSRRIYDAQKTYAGSGIKALIRRAGRCSGRGEVLVRGAGRSRSLARRSRGTRRPGSQRAGRDADRRGSDGMGRRRHAAIASTARASRERIARRCEALGCA